MDTVRAFIAVDIGNEIRGKLDELQRKLKKVHANIRWVKPRNIHLTLAFLGEVPANRVDSIKEALRDACAGQPAFDLIAVGTGFFGKPRYPRVIWAGVSDCAPLKALQNRIGHALHQSGIEFDEKRFSPHLTLGRVKGIDRHIEPLLEKIGKYGEADLGGACIAHVELVQSKLAPHGAEYEILQRVALCKDR